PARRQGLRQPHRRRPYLCVPGDRAAQPGCRESGPARRRLVLQRFGRRGSGWHGGYRDARSQAAAYAHRQDHSDEGREKIMLTLLLEAALRSLLLGAIVWFGLKLLRIRDPRAQMTAWIVVLLASLSMPVLMRCMVVSLPTAAPPLRIVQMIEDAPVALLPPTEAPAAAVEASASRSPPAGVEAGVDAAAPIAIARSLNWLAIATGIYLAVAGVLLLRLLVGIVLTWRLARAACPIDEGWASNVRVSNVGGVPVTFGTTILLPPD